MPADTPTITGRMQLELRGPDGQLKATRDVDNMVVTTGITAIIERLDSTPATAQPSHMGIGTSGTAPAAGNTTLTAEPTREVMTGNTSAGNVLTMVALWSRRRGRGRGRRLACSTR